MTISFSDISCAPPTMLLRELRTRSSARATRAPHLWRSDWTRCELVAWAPEEGDLAPAMTREEEAAGQGGEEHERGRAARAARGTSFQPTRNSSVSIRSSTSALVHDQARKGKMGITEAEAARIAYEIQNQVSDNQRGSRWLLGANADTKRKDTHPRAASAASAPKASAWGPETDSEDLSRNTPTKKPEERRRRRNVDLADTARLDAKLNPNAASFSLNAKAAAFVPSFKKPAAPQALQSAPQMVMYPGYPQAQGQMMWCPKYAADARA